jgi:DNA primase
MKSKEWVNSVFSSCAPLSTKTKKYLNGRGVRKSLAESLQLREWSNSLTIKDPEFEESWGRYGKGLNGSLVIPLFSPRGELIGFQAQMIHRKMILRQLSPQSEWNPVWLNVHQSMDKIWNGSTIWLVEGIFDLAALDRVLPRENSVILSCMTAKVSISQDKFLSRFCKNVKIVFDMDEAGHKGSDFAMRSLRRKGIQVARIKYPSKDPGDLWKEGGDKELKRVFSRYIDPVIS